MYSCRRTEALSSYAKEKKALMVEMAVIVLSKICKAGYEYTTEYGTGR